MKKCTVGTVALATAALFFASCSNDDNEKPVTDGALQNISIRIAQPETRAVADPAIEANQVVTFTDGNLFLTKSNGEILYVYNFSSSSPTDVNDSSPGSTILISDAVITPTNQDGVIIENVSGDVHMAYIVGNTGSLPAAYSTAAAVGKNISAVQAVQLTPDMEYDAADQGLATVSLYGEGLIVSTGTTNPVTDNLIKKVEIDLYPHVARIELYDITGAGDITQFQVNGVYINNYYPSMTLNYVPGTVVNQGQGGTSVYDAGQTVYTTAMDKILYDSDKNSYFDNAATSLTKTAGSDDEVWAYNLLAAPVVTASDPMYSRLGTETTLPAQLIVQVEGVEVSDGSDYSGMKYVTVRRLRDSNTNAEITHFKAGYIYTIDKGVFEFEAKNVKDEANLEDIDLQVMVKPITWTVQKVRPDLQ